MYPGESHARTTDVALLFKNGSSLEAATEGTYMTAVRRSPGS